MFSGNAGNYRSTMAAKQPAVGIDHVTVVPTQPVRARAEDDDAEEPADDD
ncbi:hypothetical protein ACFQL9_14750 [Halobaculum lipolyticum]|uniref:Uncharacterized protein n=1 Tax=Halobaculum lipolyticum TaxID=3032001 RepID=A0ABD5WEK7_9EURY